VKERKKGGNNFNKKNNEKQEETKNSIGKKLEKQKLSVLLKMRNIFLQRASYLSGNKKVMNFHMQQYSKHLILEPNQNLEMPDYKLALNYFWQ
jgi:hypothetical protein